MVLFVTIVLLVHDDIACFDQMVSNMSSLLAMKYGVQPNVMIARNLVMKKWSMECAPYTEIQPKPTIS